MIFAELLPLALSQIYEKLSSLPYDDSLGTSRPEGFTHMDTVGSLIDKLITVNLKMWHNQEQLYAIRRMTPEEFINRYGDKLDELHCVIQRCCDLNVQRASLTDAIDQLVSDIVSGQKQAQVRPQHKTY
jgi:hypothetical protein